MWVRLKGVLPKSLYSHIISYPTPINLNYFWNFGFLAGILLVHQILTGLFLAMHYIPEMSLAFLSVEHIMRDVSGGWLIRYLHANGASMFFLIVYTHMFRGLFYSSYMYPREKLWNIGVIILLIMILTGFLGYVLPWGQMSFWAATVITNLATAVPLVGTDIVVWLWGGFSVSGATLTRFYSLHFFFPFILVFLVFFHLVFLHENGSNNPLGINSKIDQIPFNPYFVFKDLFSLFIFFLFFFLFVFYFPNYLGHADNYILANPLVTPTHIVPEWYFLTFYAILRSIPDKLLGVILLVLSILVFIFIPLIFRFFSFFSSWVFLNTRSAALKPIWRFFFWFFFFDCVILLYIGSQTVEYPFTVIGLSASIFYFFFLLFLLPSVFFFEFLFFYFFKSFSIIEKYKTLWERYEDYVGFKIVWSNRKYYN